jgi:tetratricopeptide (TPR) repeat protein
LDLQDEPAWKNLALCLHACIVSYTGKFNKALGLYEKATAEKCDMPVGVDEALAILFFHYACLLLKLKRYDDSKRAAENLLKARQDYPVLGFLGYQLLARMELAKASERPRKGGVVNKKALLGDAEKHLAKGKEYLNLGPAHDQFIVSELFMAQFDRARGNLRDAHNHLKQAEDAVGPFALLGMDCLLERAKLCLAQGDTENAKETYTILRSRVNEHGYHCIDKELSDLEKELNRA